METAEIQTEEKLQLQVLQLKQTITHLKEQIAWFKRQIFGKRSEKIVSHLNSQQLVFEGFDELNLLSEEKKKEVAAHNRRQPNRNGQDKIALSPDLPVKTVVIDVPEDQKVCQETGIPLVKIGEEVSHKLAHKPGSYYIKEIIRPKYAHPKKEEAGILTAALPETLLPKCKADESLLAEIVTRKFADHMPLYRIAEIMGREGVGISRKLLSQWVVRVGVTLKPLYDEMLKQILESNNVFIDETPVMLQAKGQCRQGYVWVVVGGNQADPPYRVYKFYNNRSHNNVLDVLQGYGGHLHSDKYGGYETLAQKSMITWHPCWSHIRRKFFEADTGDPPFRQWVLRKIRYLFMFEQVAWSRSPEERLRIRQEKEAPIIDEIIKVVSAKLAEGKVLPKSKLRTAIGYFCGLIPYLKNYTEHPFARLDNNVAERALRPLAIGRKNWLFFGSMEGGEAGTILLSLVQTCRGLGINPREYLEDIFRRLMSHPAKKLRELLPDQWALNHQSASSSH